MSRSLRILVLATTLISLGCRHAEPPGSRPRAAATPAPTDTTTAAPDSAGDPASVIRDYYRAIDERRYDDAYHLWASGGAASGRSLERFRDGFTHTASVDVVVGTPGPVEGAAGSRFVEIPAHIAAVATDGGRQAYVGSYVLRRSVVDGATPEQREWRFSSSKIHAERR